MTRTPRPILIAGGGPVGVIAALALARQGLPVHVFEAEAAGQRHAARGDHPRRDAGDAGRAWTWSMRSSERGYVEPLFRIWDRAEPCRSMAEFDFGMLKDETPYPFAVQCEQHKLAGMAIERLKRLSPRQGRVLGAGDVADPDRRPRRDRGRDRRRHAQGRRLLPDRLRRRPLDRTQGARHRVRGLHPSRTLHDPDHDRRPRPPVSGLHAELRLRSGRLVLGVQGERRRTEARCGACCPRPSPSRPTTS